MSEEDSNAIAYIKLQWEDIHHSRLQDWSYIGVIAGVFYAIANIHDLGLLIGFGSLGFLSSVLGASMAWQHYQIFIDKLTIIEKMEQKLGIEYPSRTTLLPVQILIFILFSGIASAFIGMTLYFWSEIPNYGFLQIYSLFVGIGFFLIVLACVILLRARSLNRKPAQYNKAYFAELSKLERCLEKLKDKPLKLIAYKDWTQPDFKEIPWESSEWDYSSDNHLMIKPVLLNHRDMFQFSVANARSKQDWHYHRFAFEIFVSNSPLTVRYKAPLLEGKEQLSKVSQGVLIIPPGLIHKVTLSGPTFVFQATGADKKISNDKVVLKSER